MKAETISTEPSTRKTSSDSWIEVTNSKLPGLKPWIQSDIEIGLKYLSNYKENSSFFERITLPHNLRTLLNYTTCEQRDQVYPKKAIMLLINILRIGDKDQLNAFEIGKVCIEFLPKLIEMGKSELYLSLKLLRRLLILEKSLSGFLCIIFLKNFGRKISNFKKIQQHKKMLKQVIKLLHILPAKQKVDFARDIVQIERDFSSQHYSEEISQILEITPFAFLNKFTNFLKNSTPEQTMLRHQGKLLHALMTDPAIAKEYYNQGLNLFFDDILRSVNLLWCNTRFILVFIVDFPFVWQNLKFRPEFISKIVKFINENPSVIEFVKEKLEVFDRFLMVNYLKNDNRFVKNLKKVKNYGFVYQRILKNLKKGKEKLHNLKNFNVVGRFLLKKSQRMGSSGEIQSGLFVSEIEKSHLLKDLKGSNSQYFMAIGSQRSARDTGILGNHRTKKLIKAFKIGEIEAETPNFSKTRVKKFRLSSKKSPYLIAINLKREGFDQGHVEMNDFLPVRREGRSKLKFIQILPDQGRGENLTKTELKFYNQNKKVKCFEIIFEKEFDSEIIDFTVRGNTIHCWGHSVYIIMKLTETEEKCNYGPIVQNEKITKKMRKLNTQICFFKHFHHCLIQKLIPFDKEYIAIIPKSEGKTLQLYNFKKDYFSYVSLSKLEMEKIRKNFL